VPKDKVMLEAISVSKYFGGFQALNRVDLQVEEGAFWGLIGPNGSGKTTFFDAISGVNSASSGRVIFKGKEITHWTPDRICNAGIARTFQIPRPFQEMTVIENVMVGAFFGKERRPASDKQAREEALKWIGFVGLHADEETMPQSLTAGNLRRLEMARVLATKPELVLADEVMSGLNQEEIQLTSQVLKKIHTELKITIVWVEHIMSALMNLVERVTVLDYGEVIAEGTPEEIAANQKVVEAYLGKDTA
jgi:branched-chain amino acid transport system ATP-binding protein